MRLLKLDVKRKMKIFEIIFQANPEFAVFGYDQTVRARKRTAPRYSR
jgi:hypothetical protein